MNKPTIKLSPLEKTAINTPTQEEYNSLMKVLTCGNLLWQMSKASPVSKMGTLELS